MSPPRQFQTKAGTSHCLASFKEGHEVYRSGLLGGSGWMYLKPSVVSAFQTRSHQHTALLDWESGTGTTLNFYTRGVSVGLEQPEQRDFAVLLQRKQFCPLA